MQTYVYMLISRSSYHFAVIFLCVNELLLYINKPMWGYHTQPKIICQSVFAFHLKHSTLGFSRLCCCQVESRLWTQARFTQLFIPSGLIKWVYLGTKPWVSHVRLIIWLWHILHCTPVPIVTKIGVGTEA